MCFKIQRLLLLIIGALTTVSCSNYYLTTTSLRNQFAGIDSTRLRPVIVRGPLGEKYNYLANPIDVISCFDKKGNVSELINQPSVEMRVTEINGKKTIFYFDRVLVTDSVLHGVRSRFAPSLSKSIKLKDIRKIEIQDGKKNFDYLSK
jgi:hypothetical protein